MDGFSLNDIITIIISLLSALFSFIQGRKAENANKIAEAAKKIAEDALLINQKEHERNEYVNIEVDMLSPGNSILNGIFNIQNISYIKNIWIDMVLSDDTPDLSYLKVGDFVKKGHEYTLRMTHGDNIYFILHDTSEKYFVKKSILKTKIFWKAMLRCVKSYLLQIKIFRKMYKKL